MMHKFWPFMALGSAFVLSACATTTANSDDAMLEAMLSGRSVMSGAALERAIAAAAAYPLGSPQNPVRAHMPRGQHAYLSRLRCADQSRPAFHRIGNVGLGVYSNIVDAYEVTCSGQAAVSVQMDMYHPGHVETRAVPGFTIVP